MIKNQATAGVADICVQGTDGNKLKIPGVFVPYNNELEEA